MKKVCVIGLGYIGLPTASLLATKGYIVHGVDVNNDVVHSINQGKCRICEPDLDVLVKAAVQSGNLFASTEPTEADVFIIAVPTPFKEGHVPDLSFVENASKMIAPFLTRQNLVILESTSPVGTSEKVSNWLGILRPDLCLPKRGEGGIELLNFENQIFVAYSPERVLPGQIIRELVENDRVIGGINVKSALTAKEFYSTFVNGNIVTTDVRTAELCKLTENAFRDVNIAFANEISNICDQLDVNVWELIRMANRHPRVKILDPGPGVGGHCIAVDPWFIVDAVPNQAKLISAARHINDSRPHLVIEKVKKLAHNFTKPTIACLGLSFKANIDDLRESPAFEIVKSLASSNIGKLLVVEPFISSVPSDLCDISNVEFVDTNTAISQSDIIVLLVNHRKFVEIDRELLNNKVIIDTRGSWQ